MQFIFINPSESTFKHKRKTSIKHQFNKLPVVTYYKARLGQPPSLLVSLIDGERNHPRRVVSSRQGNVVIAAHEEVQGLYQTCAAANEIQFSLVFNITIKDVLLVLNVFLNINLIVLIVT